MKGLILPETFVSKLKTIFTSPPVLKKKKMVFFSEDVLRLREALNPFQAKAVPNRGKGFKPTPNEA
jgi:hypothetical protein